jgi:hypothetical protein
VGNRIGPKKVHRHSTEFKLTAVKLSRLPGVQVQTVAAGLDIHPCGSTPGSGTLHPSPMRRRRDRNECLQNRGKIP